MFSTYFPTLWWLTKTPQLSAPAQAPQILQPIVAKSLPTPGLQRTNVEKQLDSHAVMKRTPAMCHYGMFFYSFYLNSLDTQVLCAPHYCHYSPARPPPAPQGHDPRSVNRLSRSCTQPEYEHYHRMHCLRRRCCTVGENAELFKAKSVGTAL